MSETLEPTNDQQRLDTLYAGIVKTMTKEQQETVHEIVKLEYDNDSKYCSSINNYRIAL